MSLTATPICWLAPDHLVSAFYNSFTDEQTFTGDEHTLEIAREIVSRGDSMWNWPPAVEDAERFISEWEDAE